jgi:glycosyltransferase involved in cell wall biosynthesis
MASGQPAEFPPIDADTFFDRPAPNLIDVYARAEMPDTIMSNTLDTTRYRDRKQTEDASIGDQDDCFDAILNLHDLLPVEQDYAYDPVVFSIPNDFKLSIVIPVYNERATILRLLARVAAMPISKEIIIIDDGSTDGTWDELEMITIANDVRVTRKQENAGKGAALKTGFAMATGDIVVVQDADLEYDPRDIPGIIRPILAGTADVVFGSRYLEKSDGDHWFHRFGNWLLTRCSNAVTGLQLTDMETCYKVFRRDVLQSFEIEQKRFGVEPEITAKIARRRFRVIEQPVRYAARDYDGGKKIGMRDAFNALYCIARYTLRD